MKYFSLFSLFQFCWLFSIYGFNIISLKSLNHWKFNPIISSNTNIASSLGNNHKVYKKHSLTNTNIDENFKLFMNIQELEDKEPNDTILTDKTDEEKGLTHGYEGSFKVGDKVRVTKNITIYSVKQYAKNGFDAMNMNGHVVSLVLYGRKKKSLCSAITPIKVEFSPDEGTPKGMFERKWQAHFDATELELIQ